MFYATCHNRGEWVEPAGRCGRRLLEHAAPGPAHLVVGCERGQGLTAGAVCDGLVCCECGRCQAGLKRQLKREEA